MAEAEQVAMARGRVTVVAQAMLCSVSSCVEDAPWSTFRSGGRRTPLGPASYVARRRGEDISVPA